MAQNEFYVTLPSDACLGLYPDNKANNYVTKLNRPLELSGGDWEVALVDVHYPFNWHNLTHTETFVFIYTTEAPLWARDKIEEMVGVQKDLINETENLKQLALHEEELNTGFITNDTVDKMIKHIRAVQAHGTTNAHDEDLRRDVVIFRGTIGNAHMRNALDIAEYISYQLRIGQVMRAKFLDVRLVSRYDRVTGRVCMEAVRADESPTTLLIVCTNKYIMDLLKIEHYATDKEGRKGYYLYTTPMLSKERPILDDIEIIYVYSDIASHQPVGDTEVPLLGVLPAQGRFPEHSYWSCSPAFYVPVAKTFVETIEVQLNTDDGRLVPFTEPGKVLVRLHFRRRSPFL
jgi:hypothetical protein